MLGVSRKAFVLGAPRHAACWLAAAFFFSFVPIRAGERSPSCFFSDFYICRLVASGRFFLLYKKTPDEGGSGARFSEWGVMFPKGQSRGMCFSRQTARVFSSHKLACTSPMCAQPIISMHRRDWPMPPPIVRGSSPSSSILWKGKARR